MIKVGVTGGIGSGKSTICQFFRLIGIPVFEADSEARKLINNSALVRSKMILNFGEDIYLPNQTLDRKKLAEIVFNSESSLEKVNSIVHPEVRKSFDDWLKKQNAPYIVHEAAILIESGFYKMMDFTVLVTVPEEIRIQRVLKRGGINLDDLKQRMNRQLSDKDKIKMSDFTLKNDNNELLIPQLLELDKKLRKNG